ncbi:MAG TPA: VWA domain-containing protein [Acidimicrobiia bacterium]|nr:VWA domain-containing protein [Acidimicrobiia bacterium]
MDRYAPLCRLPVVAHPPTLERLVEFTHRLRAAGIPVPATTAGEMVAAVETVGLAAGMDVFHALRALSCSSYEHLQIFDLVFMSFFAHYFQPALAFTAPPARSWTISASEKAGTGDGESTPETVAVGASGVERLNHRDFADLSAAELAQVRRLITEMLWKPSLVRSRRRRASALGDRPDLRRTLRRSVGPDADLVPLAYTNRKTRRRPLIFIADVSGSMERYSEMLLYFAHSARGRLGPAEAFVFSTRLTRITRQLSRRDPTSAIAEVSQAVDDWSSGTKIGEAIGDFNRRWSRRVTRGSPIVIIVSDGWDRGEPDLLEVEMARLRRTVHRIIWLNPLAGRVGYAPETRGMQAALPYIDDFLPAANLNDLSAVIELLESVPAKALRPAI